jgi:lipoprotein-anchoring transpeptidase ErfK/SrfK
MLRSEDGPNFAQVPSDAGSSTHWVNLMLRLIAIAVLVSIISQAPPAHAYNDPIRRGLADFLNIFSVQAVPRELVRWEKGFAPGTVVVLTRERRLYFVPGNKQAIRYGVGVGRQGFTWSGTKTVSMKREWPDWNIQQVLQSQSADLTSQPRSIGGGYRVAPNFNGTVTGMSGLHKDALTRSRSSRA